MFNGGQSVFDLATFLFCVDGTVDLEPHGRLYMKNKAKSTKVNGMLDFVLKADHGLTDMGKPEVTHIYRSFFEKPKSSRSIQTKGKNVMEHNKYLTEMPKEEGTDATFIIQVQYRQNASWQGNVRWVDGKRTQKFRSTMELMKLIDEALQRSGHETEVKW